MLTQKAKNSRRMWPRWPRWTSCLIEGATVSRNTPTQISQQEGALLVSILSVHSRIVCSRRKSGRLWMIHSWHNRRMITATMQVSYRSKTCSNYRIRDSQPCRTITHTTWRMLQISPSVAATISSITGVVLKWSGRVRLRRDRLEVFIRNSKR